MTRPDYLVIILENCLQTCGVFYTSIIFQNTDCTRVLPQITGWFCSRIIFVWVSWFWWPTFPPPTLACSASSAPGECSGPPPLTIIMSPSSISSLSFFQDTIYYKWASVKMTLKFHFLWSTLFWLEESVSAVYSDWLKGKAETKCCSWSAADVWRRHLQLLHLICTPGM